MATPIPQNKLSIRARGFLGAGIAIITCWFCVNKFPEYVGSWTVTETGKVILFWVQIILFVSSIAAAITVFSLVAQGIKGIKISKIKYKDVEINFDEAKEGKDEQP